MDPYLRVLNIMICSTAVLIITMLLLIIIMRIFSYLNEQKYQQKALQWEVAYLGYLQGENDLEATLAVFGNKKNYYWLRRFFTPYLEALAGDDFQKTRMICQEIGLISYYRTQLTLGRETEKAAAAGILGSLHCRESIPERVALLKSNNFSTVLAAAQSLVKSGEAGTFAPVARALLKNTYFTYEGTTEVLIDYGRAICAPIIQLLKSYSLKMPEKQDNSFQPGLSASASTEGEEIVAFISIMIDLLGFHRYFEALPVLAKVLESRDEEITVHVLKAFLRIGAVPDGFDLKPYLTHKYWVVRSFSAQGWNLTGDDKAVPLLKDLLSDRQWWVRFHAAEALRSSGEAGFRLLQQLAKMDTEDSASAISRYILDMSEVS
jgi:hypothetical protein